MCINKLYIYSNYNDTCFILNSFGDKDDKTDHDSLDYLKSCFQNPSNRRFYHFSWHSTDLNAIFNLNGAKNHTQHTSSATTRAKYVNGSHFDGNVLYNNLSREFPNINAANLLRTLNQRINNAYHRSNILIELKVLNSRILTLIRDGLAYSLLSNPDTGISTNSDLRQNPKLRPVRGFVIVSDEDFNLFSYFSNLLKNLISDLHNRHRSGTNDVISSLLNFGPENEVVEDSNDKLRKELFTVDLRTFLSDDACEKTKNVCFSNRLYSAACSCFHCNFVLKQLAKNSRDALSNINLSSLLENDLKKVATFVKHNRTIKNLELSLLEITLSGILAKKSTQGLSEFNSEDTTCPEDRIIDKIFRPIFVIFHNYDSSDDFNTNDENSIRIDTLVLDLVGEYGELWEHLDLPIFSFFLAATPPPRPSRTEKLVDTFGSEPSRSPIRSLLGSFYKFVDHVPHGVLNESNKFTFLSKFIHTLTSNSVNSPTGSELKETLLAIRFVIRSFLCRRIMDLSRGYGLDEVKVLIRMTQLELLRAKHNNSESKKGVLENLGLFLDLFEKCTCIKPPQNIDRDLISPQLSKMGAFHSQIDPLVREEGIVRTKTGLDALIIWGTTKEQIADLCSVSTTAFSNKLGLIFSDPNNANPWALPLAVSQELNCLFVPLNILSLIRPNVGLTEKMLFSQLNGIFRQFSDAPSENYNFIWPDAPSTNGSANTIKCVVLIENLGAVSGGLGFEKRISHAVRSILDDFFYNRVFKRDFSVVFFISNSLKTSEDGSGYPREHDQNTLVEELLESGKFLKLDLPTLEMTEENCRNVFQLYLNNRLESEGDLDLLMDYISARGYLAKLDVFNIVKIVKESLYTRINNYIASRIDDPNYDDGDREVALLLDFDTLVFALEGQINKISPNHQCL